MKLVYHAPGRTAGAWCSALGAVLLLFLIIGKYAREAAPIQRNP